MRIIAVNVESLRAHVPEVAAMPAHVALTTEARATEELQRNISMDFRSFKRDVEWGHPRPPQKVTGKELSEGFAEKGGCAAVLRTPQKAQRQQFRGDSEAAEWEKKGRLMHVCIPYGKGKDSIHAFLVWGIPGAWTELEIQNIVPLALFHLQCSVVA